jgi:hypothetical protein
MEGMIIDLGCHRSIKYTFYSKAMSVFSACQHKIPQTGQLKEQKFISGGWESRSSTESLFLLRPVLCVHMATFSLCLRLAFLLCECIPEVSSSYKDTSPIGLGSHPSDLI